MAGYRLVAGQGAVIGAEMNTKVDDRIREAMSDSRPTKVERHARWLAGVMWVCGLALIAGGMRSGGDLVLAINVVVAALFMVGADYAQVNALNDEKLAALAEGHPGWGLRSRLARWERRRRQGKATGSK